MTTVVTRATAPRWKTVSVYSAFTIPKAIREYHLLLFCRSPTGYALSAYAGCVYTIAQSAYVDLLFVRTGFAL